jgi:Transposase IS66 family
MRLDLARLPNDPALLPLVVRDLADVLERRDAELAETKARLREAAAVFLCAETATLRPLFGEVPSRSTDVEPGGDRGADRRIAGEARPRTGDGASSLPALPAIGDLRPGGRRTRPHDARQLGRPGNLAVAAAGERLAAHVFAGIKVLADDTPVPVLDPGHGRTKKGRLWVYVRDDRPEAQDLRRPRKHEIAGRRDALQKIGELYAIERATAASRPTDGESSGKSRPNPGSWCYAPG